MSSPVIYRLSGDRGVVATFEVVVEPNRRRILDLLLEGERPVGDLVRELAVSQPAVSRHLRVLRDAGLVDVRADAQRRLYRARAEPLRAIDDWPASTAAQWAPRLDHLERHLDVTGGWTTPTQRTSERMEVRTWMAYSSGSTTGQCSGFRRESPHLAKKARRVVYRAVASRGVVPDVDRRRTVRGRTAAVLLPRGRG